MGIASGIRYRRDENRRWSAIVAADRSASVREIANTYFTEICSNVAKIADCYVFRVLARKKLC